MIKERIEPGPGQESVWDYPRPPRLEPSKRRVRIEFAGRLLVDSRETFRILETSHPPTYYIPPHDVDLSLLEDSDLHSFCEWKGQADYRHLRVDDRQSRNAAWLYPDPVPAFAPIAGYLSFYPSRVDACWLDEERIEAQEGDFYGGWISSDIVGPFKGGSGSQGW